MSVRESSVNNIQDAVEARKVILDIKKYIGLRSLLLIGQLREVQVESPYLGLYILNEFESLVPHLTLKGVWRLRCF